jgi:ATP-binding cassette subfamily F protein 3
VTDTLLLVADGKVNIFDGDLDDYRQWVKDHETEDHTASDDTDTSAPISKKQQRQNAAELRKKLQPLRNKVKKLEQQIEQLNKEKANIHTQLAETSVYEDKNKQQLKDLLETQTNVEKQLAELEEHWMDALEELDKFEDI